MAANNASSAEVSAAPYPPSSLEAQTFYYALPSQPRLVARSSTYVWVEPTGPEAYSVRKESTPFIASHPLRAIWEATVGPAIVAYLDARTVQWTSLDPLRMGKIGDTSPPPIVWIGVVPGSLSAEEGIEVATHCRNILTSHGIDDVHVEIRESEVHRSSSRGLKLFRPDARTPNPVAIAREPLSTSIGLPICAEATPSVGGMGGFFISDPRKPGKLFLVTARHVLFPPDKDANEFFHRADDNDSSGPRKNVLLFSDAAMEKHMELIRLELTRRDGFISRMEGYLRGLDDPTDRIFHPPGQDERDIEMEKKKIRLQLQDARGAVADLEVLRADVTAYWRKPENRVLGHVLLSPPIRVPVPESGSEGSESGLGFAEDWAVVEVDGAMVNAANFVGNAVDLASCLEFWEFMIRMCPKPWPHACTLRFRYPHNRLLEFSGTIPDEELWGASAHTRTPNSGHDHEDDRDSDNDNGGGGGDDDPDRCTTVLKRSLFSGLTIGRPSPLRSFIRVFLPSPCAPASGQPESPESESESAPSGHWQTSKAVTVLPRSSSQWPRSDLEPFAQPGDSGSAVVDERGRLAGMIVGGASGPELEGLTDGEFDCVYLVSGEFLRGRMAECGIEADFAPALAAAG